MFQTELEPQPTATRWDEAQEDPIRSHKRRANEYMRDALRLLDPDELIPFFCECDHPECFATVWLSGRRFDRLRVAAGQALSAHAEAPAIAAVA